MNCLKKDVYINMTNASVFGSRRCFVLNSKTHGVFGHDSDRDFVFNFYTPLLIGCGFPEEAESSKPGHRGR